MGASRLVSCRSPDGVALPCPSSPFRVQPLGGSRRRRLVPCLAAGSRLAFAVVSAGEADGSLRLFLLL